jgi:hypothetical protein
MAAGTDGIAVRLEAQAVGIMTIAADDPLMVHAALDEGTEDKDLVFDLAVGEIEVRLQQGQPKTLVQGRAGFHLVPDATASGVAAGTGLGLKLGVAGWLAAGFARIAGKPPDAAIAILQVHQQPSGRIIGLDALGDRIRARRVRRPRSRRGGLGPVPMAGTGSMAGLAGDVNLRVAGVVGVARDVIALLEIRGVAVRALVIPGLVRCRPVQGMSVVQGLAGIEMEPDLATLVLGPRIPGQAQALEPAARKFDQILLEGRPAEGVADGKVLEFAIRTLGMYEEAAIPAEEAGGHPLGGELGVFEITEYRLGGSHCHGPVVIRATPEGQLLRVALATDRRAHKTPLGAQGIQERVRPGIRWGNQARLGRQDGGDQPQGEEEGTRSHGNNAQRTNSIVSML